MVVLTLFSQNIILRLIILWICDQHECKYSKSLNSHFSGTEKNGRLSADTQIHGLKTENWKIALVLFLECEICWWSADDVFKVYILSYQGSLLRPLQTTSFGHTDSYLMKSLSLIIFIPPCHKTYQFLFNWKDIPCDFQTTTSFRHTDSY